MVRNEIAKGKSSAEKKLGATQAVADMGEIEMSYEVPQFIIITLEKAKEYEIKFKEQISDLPYNSIKEQRLLRKPIRRDFIPYRDMFINGINAIKDQTKLKELQEFLLDEAIKFTNEQHCCSTSITGLASLVLNRSIKIQNICNGDLMEFAMSDL